MDRSWMYVAPRSSQSFVNGVKTFLNFAFERSCVDGRRIKCPCINCLNMSYQTRQIVVDHLICSGFCPNYFKWVYHGEGIMATSTSTTHNNGVYPTRGEMYVKPSTHKDGSLVDDKATEVVDSLNAIASGSLSTPGDEDFANDNYSKVKGPEEKRGYVRSVGRMPTVKKNDDSSTDAQTIHQLKSVVNAMLNIIQEHIPNANLSAVLNSMNIEVSYVVGLWYCFGF